MNHTITITTITGNIHAYRAIHRLRKAGYHCVRYSGSFETGFKSEWSKD